jgi:nuclear receptor-binding protein
MFIWSLYLIIFHSYIFSHLHTTCDPPIVHGNLNCDTIFIQHNGLVKIGSVAPDIIHHNVKTCRDSIRNLHFFAPEWGEDRTLRGQPIDIYAFGMAALETAALDIQATPPPPNGANKGMSL